MTRAAPAALDPPPLLSRLRVLLAARLGLHFDERQDDRLTAALTRVAGPVSRNASSTRWSWRRRAPGSTRWRRN
ncbi:hypothetical protein ACFJIX_01415 [Roseateles sp. UC29_93]|uniref:hypothetical protein n=1 Tax=Roseateles sp. UC29_93 TaxID=3350177 RepID=UPI00366D17DD